MSVHRGYLEGMGPGQRSLFRTIVQGGGVTMEEARSFVLEPSVADCLRPIDEAFERLAQEWEREVLEGEGGRP
jgi:hypothetical protein